jgi:hypothetical protein
MIMNDSKSPKSTLVEIKESVSILDRVFNKKRVQEETKQQIDSIHDSLESFREYSERLDKHQLLLLFLSHLVHDFNNSTLKDFKFSMEYLNEENKKLLVTEKSSFEEYINLIHNFYETFKNIKELEMKSK